MRKIPPIPCLFLFFFSLFILSVSSANTTATASKIQVIPANSHFLINISQNANKTYIYKPPRSLNRTSKISYLINPVSLDSPELLLDLDIKLNVSNTRKTVRHCEDLVKFPCSFETTEANGTEISDFANATRLYLEFQCRSPQCLFKITILDSKEVKLAPFQSHIFFFKRSKSEIFNISLPPKDSFDRVVVTISFQKHKDLKSFSLTPSMSFNNSDPNSCIVYQESTKVILVIRNNTNIDIYGKQMSLELVARKLKLYFEIHYAVFSNITTLNYDTVYYDSIDERRFSAYKLLVPNGTNEIYFDLKNHFGDKKSLIISSPDFISQLNSDLDMKSAYFSFDHPAYLTNIDNELSNILKKGDFIADSQGYIYFIVAPSLGCFSLEVSLKNQKILPLKLSKFLRKRIENLEVQNLEIQVPPTSGEVSIDFSLEYGNADLYLSYCETKCSLLELEDLRNGQFMEVIKSQDHRMVKFQPQCSNSWGLCKYLITVFGNSSFSLSSKYHILVKQGGNHLVDLPENRPITLLLEKDNDYFCRFWLEQDSSLQQVFFSISSISINFYVASSLECLKQADCKEKTKGDAGHPIYETLENLQSENVVYYIKIVGAKTTRAVFYVEVIRKGVPSIINLYEGIPLSGVLDQTHTTQLYSFKVNMKKKQKIYINLNSDKEKLIMYASDHHALTEKQVFTETFHKAIHWKSKSGLIEIKPTHKHYSKSTTYYILVTHMEDLRLTETGSTHEYEEVNYYIMFSTDTTLKSLQNNVPFYGKILPGQTSFFKFFVNPEEEEVIVTKFLMRESMNTVLEQQDLNMIVSPTPFETVNLSNIMNLTTLFTDEKTGTLYNSYDFTNETLSILCDVESHAYKKVCPLYISLNNRAKNELLYGLTVNIKGLASELFDGVESALGLSELSGFKEKRYFYKIKDSFKSLDVFSEADFGTVYDLNVMFMDHRKNKLTIFDYKTIENSVFSSKNKSIHSIQITKEDVHQYCQIHCILIVSISMSYDKSALLPDSYYFQSELIYTLVTSEIAVLKEGRHLIFGLKAKHYKYFSYPLNEFLQNFNGNDSLVISLTPLVGSANFYVSESNDTTPTFPDAAVSQFYSYQSHLTIRKDSLHSTYSEALRPVLMIGVYSTLGGKFIIDIIQNNLVVIYPDFPLNILVLAKEERAYEFTNYWFINGFNIKLYLDSGKGFLLVFKIDDNKLMDELIFNTLPLYNISLIEGSLNSISVSSDNPAYCWGCSYYVMIDAVTNVQGQLTLSEKGGVKQMAMNTVFFDSMLGSEDSTKYRVSIPLDKTTEVVLNLYSGSAYFEAGLTSGYYYYSDVVYNYLPEVDSLTYQKIVVPFSDIGDHFEDEIKSMGLKGKDKENYLHSQEMTLNLKVTPLLNSSVNYSIETYTRDDIRLMKEGVITYTVTNASKKSIFLYEKYTNYSAKSTAKNLNNPHLLIKSLDPSINLNVEVNLTFVEKKSDYSSSKPKTLNMTLLSSTMDSLEFLFPNDKIGFYYLEVRNTNKKVNLEYFLIVSAHKLITLPYEVSLSVSLPKKGVKYYETYVPKRGVLALEILECYGSVKIGRTDSYSNLMNKKGILEQFEVIKDLDYVNYYKVKKPGHFYFLVESTADEFTNIQMSMRHYNSLSEIPQKRLKLPDNGNIDYQLKGNQVSLKFAPIVCQKCPNEVAQNAKVNYELIIGNSLFDVDSIGKCRMGYPKFYQKKMKENLINENVTTITINAEKLISTYNASNLIPFDFVHNFEDHEQKLKEKGFKHYLTVRAHITNYPKLFANKTTERILPAFDIYYETLELNFREGNTGDVDLNEIEKDKEDLQNSNLNYKKLLIIAIIVIIVLIICVALACYYERDRKRRHGLIHFTLDESKESRRPVRLDQSSDKLDIEMETKNFSSNKYNADNF